MRTVCNCGFNATREIHFTNYPNDKWTPVCERCYGEHLSNAEDTNRHEMEKFEGAYGLVTWEERMIDVVGELEAKIATLTRQSAADKSRIERLTELLVESQHGMTDQEARDWHQRVRPLLATP